jgi:ankyrin repeat protein
MNILVLSVLCATSFLSHGMETKPMQEEVEAANNKLWEAVLCAMNFLTNGMETKQEAIKVANSRLWEAVESDDLAKVEQLITEGIVDVNSVDKDGNTTLMRAAWNNNANIVNALVKNGADVNSVNKYGYTALMRAACNNNADNINTLIKAGADVNSVNKDGETALIDAAYNKDADNVNALIKAGADVNSADKNGETALMHAIRLKNYTTSIQIFNPSQKSFARKKIALLLMIYKEGSSCLSVLPKEVLKIIITCMHPEYAMDRESLRCFHPDILVDNIPLENLALLVKDETLNQDTILAAWQKKINGITESLKAQKKLNDTYIQEFATEALTKITKLFTNK